jgi:hypothetical protein
MTLNQSALLQITDALRTADGGDVMRQMLGFMLRRSAMCWTAPACPGRCPTRSGAP